MKFGIRLSFLFLLSVSVPGPLLGMPASKGEQASIWTEPSTGMTFVFIPSGTFMMGSPLGEASRQAPEVQHQVRLTRPFYLGKTEVTQQQWQAVMGSNPSYFQRCGPDCPVERVNWYQIQAFIRELNRSNPGSIFRLPTEAEWEYACRAGTRSPFSTGANLTTEQANYDGDYPYNGFPRGRDRKAPSPVASFAPNAFGLYDMEGNVWEWCRDWFCPYPTGAVTDPVATCRGAKKVIRGGSWFFGADSARCAARYNHRPQDRGFSLGFRLVRETR